ncbi:GIY-YIG nuclease family protein [Sphingobacterium daejeonense]|uniref:GIY-YIG nuclease family protein n=1 Tax=Sphingobacterium daejeonense TaxID=371142 RepID=UPI0010C4B54B|nr:GIY-YIG nuclease family protein [Sphingobacterium daejeonense]VTP98818.1 T5orf172 domain [Sphingobacterium daejeonense]
MDNFTKQFINKHKIDKKHIFDAKGKTINSLKLWMKANGKLYAYNSTFCKNGHSIKSKSGHCIVCNVTRIAFVKRKYKNGFLYVFGTKTKQYIKVGMTTENIFNRLQKLNSRRVGGVNDWEALLYFKVDNTNSIEFDIHKILKPYEVKNSLYQGTQSKELFRCSYFKAESIINEYIKSNNILVIESKQLYSNYNDFDFKNLRAIYK